MMPSVQTIVALSASGVPLQSCPTHRIVPVLADTKTSPLASVTSPVHTVPRRRIRVGSPDTGTQPSAVDVVSCASPTASPKDASSVLVASAVGSPVASSAGAHAPNPTHREKPATRLQKRCIDPITPSKSRPEGNTFTRQLV